MSRAVIYCGKATAEALFSAWKKDVTGSFSTYINTIIRYKTFERAFEEYRQAKDDRGREFRLHSDNKSSANGQFCLSVALKRKRGGAENTRVLTLYEWDEPNPDKILVRGEFGTVKEADVNEDTFTGTFLKRVLVDMLKQVDARVVKDVDLDDVD